MPSNIQQLKEMEQWPMPNEKYICQTCHREYNYMHNLRRHLKYECGSQKLFHCPFCKYKAKRRDVLRAHTLTVHRERSGLIEQSL